jgi:CBS domain-containing protein
LPATVVALHDASVAAGSIGRVIATVHDAITRRLIDLALAESPVDAAFTWLVLGSVARREAFPSSDQDSAIVWHGDGDAVRAPLAELAAHVVAGVARSGVPACPNGAVASKPLFLRSEGEWRRVATSWLDDPTQEKALILVSVLVDGRPVWPEEGRSSLSDVFTGGARHPLLMRRLASFALSHKPPTGFFRDFVVEHDGERRGTLDIKRGGLVPVVDIARWAGMKAGVAEASTLARLDAAERHETLPAQAVATLRVAFELFSDLRMGHQIDAVRANRRPDDAIDPRTLEPLTRRYLKDAFRAVADVQRGLVNELGLT